VFYVMGWLLEKVAGRCVVRCVPAPGLIWVHGKSGDMMIDGVPGVRAAERVRPLDLCRGSTPYWGGRRLGFWEPTAGIS
jgi:hypothetical protein